MYRLLIELIYLGGHESLDDDARRSLRLAILAELGTQADCGFVVPALTVSVRPDRAVEVLATLKGNAPARLTSPLEAITYLDAALDRSLKRTGLFEEFDVARKALHSAPADHREVRDPRLWPET
jgi:hypothetical protein